MSQLITKTQQKTEKAPEQKKPVSDKDFYYNKELYYRVTQPLESALASTKYPNLKSASVYICLTGVTDKERDRYLEFANGLAGKNNCLISVSFVPLSYGRDYIRTEPYMEITFTKKDGLDMKQVPHKVK